MLSLTDLGDWSHPRGIPFAQDVITGHPPPFREHLLRVQARQRGGACEHIIKHCFTGLNNISNTFGCVWKNKQEVKLRRESQNRNCW